MSKFDEKKNKILSFMKDDLYVPMKKKELALLMQVKKEDKEIFNKIISELLNDGFVEITKKGKLKLSAENFIQGVFVSNARGFGFVAVEGQEKDYFVPEECVHGAFHKDTVLARILKHSGGKRQEAEIIKVLEHGITEVVGIFQKSENYGFVVPDDLKMSQDIFISKENTFGAVDGHKVVVQITDYGKKGKKPEGRIVEIIGHMDDPGVDILSVIKSYGLPFEFNEKVLNQASKIPEKVTEKDCEGRLDLRNLLTITIDGEDAKDLDDAVSLTETDEGYRLGVHIADVTNYVPENSALDQEALKRGTSVYLVDRVIPMLPHILSNGICSLNVNQDRLTLSCLMTVNFQGQIIDYEIAESVIRVKYRMDYTTVQKILNHDRQSVKDYKSLTPTILKMNKVAGLLRRNRRQRGSIDFDFPESRIILSEDGKPVNIVPYERTDATRMIEDFMLAANETVAEHFFWQEIPFLYRTHGLPDSEKVQKLLIFIQNFGYYIKRVGKTKSKVSKDEIHPKEIQKLLDRISGTPEEALIGRLTLRSMKRAQYSVTCDGHFGLACRFYCHFTSPIRRYPDLQIHRIIKEQIRGKLSEKRIQHYKGILGEVAKHCSETEHRADEAERETDKLKKAEYMEQRIGKEYAGVISGITRWGIYVELPNTVEGLIHVSTIPGDFYYYREETYEMVGEETGRVFRLGDSVKIRVNGVQKDLRIINFTLVEKENGVN